MKLTYEQMKERFEIRYVADSTYHANLALVEVFAPHHDRKSFKTVEEARTKLKENIESEYFLENNRFHDIKETFEEKERNFFFNALFVLKGEKVKFYKEYEKRTKAILEVKTEKLLDIEKMEVAYLDKNKIYEVAYPDTRNGDIVYVSVHKKNHLEIGVHKMKLHNVSRFRERFTANAEYQGMDSELLNNECDFSDKKRYCLRIDGIEGDLSTGYSYHKVFFNKNDAEIHFNKELDKQIAILEDHKIKNPS